MLVVAMFVVVLAIVATANVGLVVGCVGRQRINRVRRRPEILYTRLIEIAPYLGVIIAVLLINKGINDTVALFARRNGVEATALFYAIEGDFVAWFQSLFPDVALPYFGVIYILGYVVLLTFPVVAYLFAADAKPFKLLTTAYTVNYAVAIVAYTTVLAYGPRVYSADVSHGLIELFPEITGLLALANSAENVFPSLHTSMAVTVFLIARQTETAFPRWTPIAAFLSINVVVSTMALGIHWLIDVLAGILLAVGSVTAANHWLSSRQ